MKIASLLHHNSCLLPPPPILPYANKRQQCEIVNGRKFQNSNHQMKISYTTSNEKWKSMSIEMTMYFAIWWTSSDWKYMHCTHMVDRCVPFVVNLHTQTKIQIQIGGMCTHRCLTFQKCVCVCKCERMSEITEDREKECKNANNTIIWALNCVGTWTNMPAMHSKLNVSVYL